MCSAASASARAWLVRDGGALKSGDLRLVERDIEAVVEACRPCGVLSKVIIEAALLTDDEKVKAADFDPTYLHLRRRGD